jgi:hypothetical protein
MFDGERAVNACVDKNSMKNRGEHSFVIDRVSA